MAQLNRWIGLDSRNLDESSRQRTKGPDGIQVELSLSPYDLPEAVRARKEEGTNFFVIEFRYLHPEPIIPDSTDEGVQLFLGKNSGRIHQIRLELPPGEKATVSLGLRVKNALERIHGAHRGRDFLADSRFKIAEKVIDDQGEQLFPCVGPA